MKIPAIKGKIGETIYYIANLTFQQINQLVKRVDSELHTSTSLKEEIQRSLSDNYIKIKQYILNRDDHFFNSLVLAVYDGLPVWTEIRYELEEEWYHNVGVLHFNGDEKIFPVDGQHRVEGIKAALREKSEIASETISVILIGHNNTPEGMEKSRRIFSTLNRYAKTVRLGDIIALDEDDVVAITTRIMLENFPLFTGDKIKASNSKSIPSGDKKCFTTLMTLYDCHLELLKYYKFGGNISNGRLKDYLRVRPNDDTISGFYDFLVEFWSAFYTCFTEIKNYIEDTSLNAAEQYRDPNNGGNIFFRPISLYPFISAITTLAMRAPEHNIISVMEQFRNINRTVSSEPWNRIIWNPITRKMVMRNQSLVKYLFMHMYNHDILTNKEKIAIKTKYAAVHNISIEDAIVMLNNISIHNA